MMSSARHRAYLDNIGVCVTIEGSPPTFLDGKLATNGTAQNSLALNRPASCDLTYGISWNHVTNVTH